MASPSTAPLCQPLTFGGVGGFARASPAWLLGMQAIVATMITGALLWLLIITWMPVVESAIERLPAGARISNQTLEWPGQPAVLASRRFLCIRVLSAETLPGAREADVEVILDKHSIRFRSILGVAELAYPRGWRFLLGRADVEAWWGARKGILLGAIASGLWLGLLTSWALLATVYWIPTCLGVFYLDRQAGWIGCWKLAASALLPGAIVLTGAAVLYGLQRLDLIGLLLAWVLHLVIGWVYIAGAVWRLPRMQARSRTKGNPFRVKQVRLGRSRTRG